MIQLEKMHGDLLSAHMRTARALFACGLVALSLGCDGKEEVKPDPSTFSALYTSYLSSCKECHVPGNVTYTDNVPNLDMSTEDKAYASLMLAADTTKRKGADCAAVKYVEAGQSARSLLYAIMDVSTGEALGTGDCMAAKHIRSDGGLANDPTPEQKQKIREWIDKGAPRN